MCSSALPPSVKPRAAAQQRYCLNCHYTIWTADFKGDTFQVLLGREDLAASLQQALSQLQADQQVCLRLSLFPSPQRSRFVTTGCWLAADLGPC